MKSIVMKNNNKTMYALYVKTFSSTKKNKTPTLHLADFDSLQSLLSEHLTSLLPSGLTHRLLVSVLSYKL